MRTKYFLTACILLLIFLQGCAWMIRGTNKYTRAQVHGVNQDCNICHISHKMKGAGLLKEPVSDLCLKCHPDRKAPTEHVVDVIPSMKIEGLPLIEGKMTCVTCHDSHKNIYKSMLRVNPKDLCQSCHKY